jgi:hypothetical protein
VFDAIDCITIAIFDFDARIQNCLIPSRRLYAAGLSDVRYSVSPENLMMSFRRSY